MYTLRSRWSAFLLVLIVLVIAGCVIGLVYTSQHRPAPASHAKAAMATTITQLPSLTNSLLPLLTSHLSYLSGASATANQTPAVGYQVAGYDFQILLPTGDSLSLTDTAEGDNETTTFSALTAATPYITTYLKQYGLSVLPNAASPPSVFSSTSLYAGKADLCQLTIYTLLTLTCVSPTQAKDLATSAAPFVALYAAASPDTGMNTVDSVQFSASQTAGDSLASIALTNNAGETDARFYKIGSGNWQLVNLTWYNDPHEDGDVMPNCEDFESETAVRQAFSGQSCYDSVSRLITTVH